MVWYVADVSVDHQRNGASSDGVAHIDVTIEMLSANAAIDISRLNFS
jgi:hypothetical protein